MYLRTDKIIPVLLETKYTQVYISEHFKSLNNRKKKGTLCKVECIGMDYTLYIKRK